jgi:L-aspartate oxidase
MKSKSSISQQGKQYSFDIIVIGSGIAGLIYILELSRKKPDLNIALITKRELADSNSSYAKGGIAASNNTERSIELHLNDTLKASGGLADRAKIKDIVSKGAEAIQVLVALGVTFDQAHKEYDLAHEGGHSERRIYHYKDCTGKEIMRALTKQILDQSNVSIFTNHIAVNLITHPNNAKETIGAYVLDEQKHIIHTMISRITVLATGGAGKVYRYTSNLDVATGDGIAMAHRIGAKIANMEFYQFHPTLLYHPQENNFLITEALRGEGAYLLNATTKERFMYKYAPDKLELATRDVVARAIFDEIEKSDAKFVYLDVRHLAKDFLLQRFPTLFKRLKELNIDISKDLIPVVPAAHYLCGGIVAEINGKTSINRLLAIGETAMTGLHGANRLASNSLLEGVVQAISAARYSNILLQQNWQSLNIPSWCSECVTDSRRESQINAHWRGLRGEMTSYAGIIRTNAGLNDLLKLIQTRKEMIEDYYWRHEITRDLIELRNILLVAELIVTNAIARTKSCGGHYREDG